MIPRCFAASFNRQCWHKFRIFYMLTLYQWLPLSQKDFPDFVNPETELFTLTKGDTAIRLQFGANGEQDDPPIHILKIKSDYHGLATNFKPIFNAAPKCFFFTNNYKTLYSKLRKTRSEITINLETGTTNLLVKPTNYEKFPKMRDAVAKFAKKYKRLPCRADLMQIVPGCTQSLQIRNAVQAGYLKKILHKEPRRSQPSDPIFYFEFTCRTLYMPLYPELHPDQQVDNYERYLPPEEPGQFQKKEEPNAKNKALRQQLQELTKL